MREKQSTQPSALIHLERERNRLLATREKLLEAFIAEVSGGKRRKMAQLFLKIRQTNDFLQTLGEIADSLNPAESAETQNPATPSVRCSCTRASKSSPPTRTSSFSSSPARR